MMRGDASTERLVPTGALHRYAGLFALILVTFFASACGGEGPCASKTCFFGECDPESGQCVNKPGCRTDQECKAGFSCAQTQECVPENTCESSDDCPGGICEQGACVNPDTCEVNSDCVPGIYCSAEGTCVPDPCNSVTCDRGVCERGTGNCVAEDSCDERLPAEQCDSGEKCLDDECVSRENFCDKLTCERGVCSFEEGGCVNADDCETSNDCLEDRVCGGGSCLDAVSCRNDDMEPNDTMGEATDLFDWAPNGMIQASLCEQDTDIYDVTTTDVVPSDFSGQMVATVTVPERDVGLGELTVTMNGPDGSRIGKSTFEATPQDRSVTLKTSPSDSDHGTYTVEVSPGQDVAQNGLEYWLSVRIEKPGATGRRRLSVV